MRIWLFILGFWLLASAAPLWPTTYWGWVVGGLGLWLLYHSMPALHYRPPQDDEELKP